MDIIRTIVDRKSGHLCSSLSVVDILYALFLTDWETENRSLGLTDLVLSKGHAAPALYSVLRHFDVKTRLQREDLRRLGSPFEGHPRRNAVPTCIVSTGSLGIGLTFAIGRAIAMSREGSPRRLVVIASDGELQEGISYEALRVAGNERPSGLTIVIDSNRRQTSGKLKPSGTALHMASVLGIDPILVDGHNISELVALFCTVGKEPRYLIASTTTCKGLKGYEGGPELYGEAIDQTISQKLLEG